MCPSFVWEWRHHQASSEGSSSARAGFISHLCSAGLAMSSLTQPQSSSPSSSSERGKDTLLLPPQSWTQHSSPLLPSTRYLSSDSLTPAVSRAPHIRCEPFAKFLQHQLVLAREKIRLVVISSYFHCSSQMKSDSLLQPADSPLCH